MKREKILDFWLSDSKAFARCPLSARRSRAGSHPQPHKALRWSRGTKGLSTGFESSSAAFSQHLGFPLCEMGSHADSSLLRARPVGGGSQVDGRLPARICMSFACRRAAAFLEVSPHGSPS